MARRAHDRPRRVGAVGGWWWGVGVGWEQVMAVAKWSRMMTVVLSLAWMALASAGKPLWKNVESPM